MKLKTHQELAQAYGIHRKTLYRKLVAAGIVLKRGLISQEEQEKIYKILGRPKGFKKDDGNQIAF